MAIRWTLRTALLLFMIALTIMSLSDVESRTPANAIKAYPNLRSLVLFQVFSISPLAITSVGPIAANPHEQLVISGSGFGNNPTTVAVGDGSVDTVTGSVDPSLAVWDNCLPSTQCATGDNWRAGNCCALGKDSIGIILVSWSDTRIVLGGFGAALGTDGQKTWKIAPGDKIIIQIFGPNNDGMVQYETNVVQPTTFFGLSQNTLNVLLLLTLLPFLGLGFLLLVYLFSSGEKSSTGPTGLRHGQGSLFYLDPKRQSESSESSDERLERARQDWFERGERDLQDKRDRRLRGEE